MDPTATYNAMLDYAAGQDVASAADCASDLFRWFARDGFNPRGISRDQALGLCEYLINADQDFRARVALQPVSEDLPAWIAMVD